MSTKKSVWNGTIEKIRESQSKAELPISAAKEILSGNLQAFLEELAEISAELNLIEIVTPINATEEKEKWLELARSGCLADPVFQYNSDLLKTVSMKGVRLRNLEGEFLRMSESLKYEQPERRAICSLILSRFQETEMIIRSAEAILGQDVPYLNTVMGTIFPEIQLAHARQLELLTAAITEAERLIETRLACAEKASDKHDFALLSDHDQKQLRGMKIGPEEIREYFWIAAKQYGIEMTRPIEVSTSAAAIDIRDKSSVGPIVVIPRKREPVDGLKLLELIAHEIEGHWRDSENAQAILPMLGGGALKPTDETIYEGHAMLLEHQAKYMLEGTKKGMAKPWAVLAMSFAKAGCSFAETAAKLFPLMQMAGQEPGEDELEVRVWKVCSRIYRGLVDTSKNPLGYAFTKDQAYFSGRMLAEELFEAGLGHLFEFSCLSIRDLEILSQAFKIEPTDIKYRRRADVLPAIAEMLLAKCN